MYISLLLTHTNLQNGALEAKHKHRCTNDRHWGHVVQKPCEEDRAGTNKTAGRSKGARSPSQEQRRWDVGHACTRNTRMKRGMTAPTYSHSSVGATQAMEEKENNSIVCNACTYPRGQWRVGR